MYVIWQILTLFFTLITYDNDRCEQLISLCGLAVCVCVLAWEGGGEKPLHLYSNMYNTRKVVQYMRNIPRRQLQVISYNCTCLQTMADI